MCYNTNFGCAVPPFPYCPSFRLCRNANKNIDPVTQQMNSPAVPEGGSQTAPWSPLG